MAGRRDGVGAGGRPPPSQGVGFNVHLVKPVEPEALQQLLTRVHRN